MKRIIQGASAVAITAALGLAGSYAALAAPSANGPTEHTTLGVDGAKVMAHLRELSGISTSHAEDGYRAMGTAGYEEAAQYVESVFEAAGLEIKRQNFTVPGQEFGTVELSVDGVAIEDIAPLSYTNGTSEPLVDVPVEALSDDSPGDGQGPELGCAASDFAEVTDGAIAIVQRGVCAFSEKAAHAFAQGVGAIVIVNTEDAPVNGTLGGQNDETAPTLGVKKSVGDSILAQIADAGDAGVTGSLTLEASFVETETFNIIAETPGGDENQVQVIGAHLDGVEEGPGVNDNASGVAALLAVAEGISEQDYDVDRKVRFGVWGAEEVGLVGSTEYVNSLSAEELGKIDAYFNYDMIGSNNFVIATLDSNGDYVAVPEGVMVPEGSEELEQVYTDYFDSVGQPYVGSEFSGRSDYQAFMDAGIPVGGLFTGADAVKTEEEAELFGGTAGEQQDTNYHQVTDTIENVNQEAVGIMAPAIGYAAHVAAYDLVDEQGTEPTNEPTNEPTGDSKDDDAEGGDGKDVDADAKKKGDLPRTGSEIATYSVAGVALILIGGATLVAMRRKH